VNNIASWLSFFAAFVSGFHEAELPLDDAKRVLHPALMLAFMYSMLMAVLFLRGCCFAFYLADARRSASHIHLGQPRAVALLVAGIGWRQIAPLHEADYPAD
jgi:hypothetical protein